jgi:hypothetical protein
VFPRIPGTADTRSVTYKAQSTDLPGFMIDEVSVKLHGVEQIFAGAANFDHNLTLELLETRDAATREMLWQWKEYARSWRNNSGSYKSAYAVDVQILMYDDLPQVIRTVTVFRMWPQAVQTLRLDGTQSQAGIFSVTFKYDSLDG